MWIDLIRIVVGVWLLVTLCRLIEVYHDQLLIIGYATGMADYALRNWACDNELSSIASAALDEIREVREAFAEREWYEMYGEVCDVWHTMVKWLFTLAFGGWMQTEWPYYVMYLLAWKTPEKHGHRYIDYQCIRHRHDKPPYNHYCSYRPV